MKLSIAVAMYFAIAGTPSWAMFKCVVDGKTAFQEQPCERAQTQTDLGARYGTIKAIAPSTAPVPAQRTPQQVVAEQEQERLRVTAEYALRDKSHELSVHQRRCRTEIEDMNNNRLGWNNNLAGATRSQAEATAASAHAVACDTRARQLQAEVDEQRRICALRGCR